MAWSAPGGAEGLREGLVLGGCGVMAGVIRPAEVMICYAQMKTLVRPFRRATSAKLTAGYSIIGYSIISARPSWRCAMVTVSLRPYHKTLEAQRGKMRRMAISS